MGRAAPYLEGVLGSLTTPFAPDLSLDLHGLEKNVAYLVQHGIKAVVCCGSVGEFASLTHGERRAIIAATVTAAGSTPVIAGVSDASLHSALDLARHAADMGATALLVTPPPFYKAAERDIVDFFTRLNRAVALPWVLYHGAVHNVTLSLDAVEEIAGLSHFAGLKEASPDMVRYYALVDRFGGKFPLVAAAENVVIFQMMAGADGLMTLSPIFAPEFTASMWQTVRSGDTAAALGQFRRLWQFRKLFMADMAAGLPIYVPYAKAALDALGLAGGPCRPPIRTLGEPERAALRRVLRDEMGLPVV